MADADDALRELRYLFGDDEDDADGTEDDRPLFALYDERGYIACVACVEKGRNNVPTYRDPGAFYRHVMDHREGFRCRRCHHSERDHCRTSEDSHEMRVLWIGDGY